MSDLPCGLNPYLIGGGTARARDPLGVELTIPPQPTGYADAQIDDTQFVRRGKLRWRPPVKMRLEARASTASPLGTLGFGFWNDPFTVSLGQGGAARRLPASPQALWFFYGSRPNDLAFAANVPGHGWKAVSLRSPAIPAALLAPAVLAAWTVGRVPGFAGPMVHAVRRCVRASEALIPVSLDSWHTYKLSWHACEATFSVDDRVVLVADNPPAKPLGFVAWIDNQYASLSPRDGLRFGRVATAAPQSLEIRNLVLESI